MLSILNNYNSFIGRSKLVYRSSLTQALTLISALPTYYRINDLIWQDGMLVDFLQKKIADKWIRRFLVCSSYLFSERVLFEIVVRFYIDLVVWPTTKSSAFDFANVSMTLVGVTIALLITVLTLNIGYLYVLIF